MLTRVAAQNFKAFGENPGLQLSLSGFGLLLGQNNSGKTSALDAVALFVQTARAVGGQSGLVWSGDLVDLGLGGEHAVHNGVPTSVLSIAVEMQTPQSLLEFIHRRLPQMPARSIGYRVSFQRIPNRYQYEFLVDGELIVRNFLRDLPGGGNRAELDIPSLSSQPNRMEFVAATHTQAGIFNFNLFDAAVNLPPPVMSMLLLANQGIQAFKDVLSTKMFFLGASRGAQKRGLSDTVRILDVGRNGEQTLQVLSTVFAKSEYRTAAAKIREWAHIFGLSDVTSGWAGGQELHSGYSDPFTSTPLPLHSAGFGSQQMLPIIVQVFASPDDAVLFIEEPEISLHPAAQVKLVQMFTEAVHTGRQVIITTHSQYLAMALQQEANHSIGPKDVCVYHFFRNEDTSTATKLEMDEKGTLRGWIPSFAEVEQELMRNWMVRVHDNFKED